MFFSFTLTRSEKETRAALSLPFCSIFHYNVVSTDQSQENLQGVTSPGIFFDFSEEPARAQPCSELVQSLGQPPTSRHCRPKSILPKTWGHNRPYRWPQSSHSPQQWPHTACQIGQALGGGWRSGPVSPTSTLKAPAQSGYLGSCLSHNLKCML